MGSWNLSIEGINWMFVAHPNSLQLIHDQISYCTNLYMVMKCMGFTSQQVWVIGIRELWVVGFKFPAYRLGGPKIL